MTLNTKILTLLVTAVLMPLSFLFGQDIEGRLLALNEVVNPSYKVVNKGFDLKIEGFRDGEHVKIDEVNVYDLDLESLRYSSSENAVVVKCFEDVDGCVMRVLIRERKKKSYRNRIVFAVPEGKSGDEVAEKLRLFLMDLSNKK